jgi:hypothetical protein
LKEQCQRWVRRHCEQRRIALVAKLDHFNAEPIERAHLSIDFRPSRPFEPVLRLQPRQRFGGRAAGAPHGRDHPSHHLTSCAMTHQGRQQERQFST